MKKCHRILLGLALLLPALPAASAISCTMTTNPTEMKVVYNYSTTISTQGTLTLSCTRDPANDPRRPWVWIGMDQATTGRDAPLDTGGSTINYDIYHGNATTGTWTNTGQVDNTSTTNGAVRERLDFGPGGGSALTVSYPFWFRLQAMQIRPAGVYVDAVPITLRFDDAGGSVITTATLNILISIPRSCRFSTPPTPINVNYPAFSPTPLAATSNFALTCTQGTTYTIALDQARSVVPNVNLSYGLTLSATTSTGTAVAQPYTVNISVDPLQAGRCTGAVCTGTDVRTLTVTY